MSNFKEILLGLAIVTIMLLLTGIYVTVGILSGWTAMQWVGFTLAIVVVFMLT